MLLEMAAKRQPGEGDGDVTSGPSQCSCPRTRVSRQGQGAAFPALSTQGSHEPGSRMCQNEELLGWSRTSLHCSSHSSKNPRSEELSSTLKCVL